MFLRNGTLKFGQIHVLVVKKKGEWKSEAWNYNAKHFEGFDEKLKGQLK